MTKTERPIAKTSDLRISFEFFPPKSPEMDAQLWQTVEALQAYQPDFVSVTYGAGGTTREPTLSTVKRLITDTPLSTASHLTCVGATREEVRAVVEEFQAAGVRHMGDFEISVSAYPERHPESENDAVDLDMLKQKVDAGATRALTQFFFDNDIFERYLERVRAAGITIPIVPGIMPIQNLTQLKRFAAMCGASIPSFLDARFEGSDGDPRARATIAAEIAAEQIADLSRRGLQDFHIYTMNRAPLTIATLDRLGLSAKAENVSGAAA